MSAPRYNPIYSGGCAVMTGAADGDFVRTTDYDRLSQQCSRYRLALELVQRGLDSGAIRSKPILEFDLEAESAPVRSLAEIINEALADGDSK